MAVATGAIIVPATGLGRDTWLDSAWIAGVCALLAGDAFRLHDDHPPRYLRWLAWSMPVAATSQAIWWHGLDPRRWDTMWVSAWLAVAVAWSLVRGTPLKMRRMLGRLDDRHTIDGAPGDAARRLSADLERVARHWAAVGGGVILLAFAVSGPWIGIETVSGMSLRHAGLLAGYFVPALLAALVTGAWIGRMAAHGRLGNQLRRHRLRLRVIPDHPDGAGGLRPLGAFYMYQSLVGAVPAAFFVVWLFLIAISGDHGLGARYGSYVPQYRWLFGAAVATEVLAFVAPMRSIHEIMRAEKEGELWRESDRLSRQIEDIRGRLKDAHVPDRKDQEGQLAALVSRFEALEATPTWPVDATIRRRFTLRNLSLLLPFAGYAVGETSFWERLSNLFGGLQ
ncbi:hypothetical protein [Rugosimonospora africana]|uniref:hypothetical protein n=1 Tax=Rugosimonospora africana TaxID=556532 RepID=UPI00194453E9|nr:hypothetical protein [Rugosimonospora africana]